MIRVIQLNAEGDPIGEPAEFHTVEQGQAFAEEKRGAPLEWLEEGRFYSLEGMTKEESDHLSATGDYPPIRFWIAGIDENNNERELEDEDFEKDEVKAYLIINKGMKPIEVYNVDTLEEAARIVCNERPEAEVMDDIRWQLKRTGRWDREDDIITIITATNPREGL